MGVAHPWVGLQRFGSGVGRSWVHALDAAGRYHATQSARPSPAVTGKKNIAKTHFLMGSSFPLLPQLGLLWAGHAQLAWCPCRRPGRERNLRAGPDARACYGLWGTVPWGSWNP